MADGGGGSTRYIKQHYNCGIETSVVYSPCRTASVYHGFMHMHISIGIMSMTLHTIKINLLVNDSQGTS